MNEVLTELSKPVWWISVVVAGILINLLSAYMKSSLDGYLSKISAWWRGRSVMRKQKWQSRVGKIRSSEQARHIVERQEVRLRLQSIHLCLLAILLMLMFVFMFTLGQTPARWIAVFFLGSCTSLFFASFVVFSQAKDLENLLREAAQG